MKDNFVAKKHLDQKLSGIDKKIDGFTDFLKDEFKVAQHESDALAKSR